MVIGGGSDFQSGARSNDRKRGGQEGEEDQMYDGEKKVCHELHGEVMCYELHDDVWLTDVVGQRCEL